MELVRNSLSGANRSGHPVQFRTLQESCRVEEISQGSQVACQASQFQSNNKGKITSKCEYTFFADVVVFNG